jgi:hypothetical protein
MKATLIISEEYKANQPCVFIFVDGNYYGDLSYPRLRNFPQDVNYWKMAISSDSDRFFSVYDVEISNQVFDKINSFSKNMKEASEKWTSDAEWNGFIPAPKKSKNSKEYKDYLQNEDKRRLKCYEIAKINEPIDKIITKNYYDLRNLLLNFIKNNEN